MVEEVKQKRPFWGIGIIGFNIALFVLYTIVLLGFSITDFVTHFFISVAHAGICVVLAIITQKLQWLLAGLVVLAIGFSTCFVELAIV